MKAKLLFITIMLANLAVILLSIHNAHAKYNRHSGHIYSCNEINADIKMAKTEAEKLKFKAEYKKYCKGH